MIKAYTAEKIFTGEGWISDHAVIARGQVIESIIPVMDLDEAIDVTHFDEGFLAPGFIDVQVYGAGERLLSVYPDATTLQTMRSIFNAEGTVLFQPTVATNTPEVFKKCIDAVRDYWESGGQGVYGLHLEGPWINEEKRGAHLAACIHSPEPGEVKDILDYGKGVVTMITLAPEVCSPEVLDLIQSYPVLLAAGHSNADYSTATRSFNRGINTVTHLFNAMSALQHRAPGLAGATLNHNKVRASIIPDGHHVDFAAVSIAKKVMGERLYAITDAVTETREGPYQHYLAGDKYEAGGILSGSSLSMFKAYRNLVQHAGISREEALRMCSLYPAQVLGCDQKFGKIAPGYSAEVIHVSVNQEKAEPVIA